jgi:RimJ/RimL family protein N-acetyltransferase
MASAVGEIRLRPITAADDAFLCALYGSTRTEELAPVPWSEEQKHAFLEMQFRAQSAHYATHYAGADFLIIELDGRPIGRLYIARWPDQIRIVDISLVPEQRGRGVGSGLLRQILDEGASSNRAVTIHVEDFNPAMRLYERLGFRPISSYGVYQLMEWRSGDQPNTASYS